MSERHEEGHGDLRTYRKAMANDAWGERIEEPPDGGSKDI